MGALLNVPIKDKKIAMIVPPVQFEAPHGSIER